MCAYGCDGRGLSNLKILGGKRGVVKAVEGPDMKNSRSALLPGFIRLLNEH